MNSEELELSLRTEFESYLKDVFAEMRQEISQLQEKFDAELERHKSELDSVFSGVLNKFETTAELDAGFKDSVIEHLRLAKDEGARITATAIAEAEELEQKSAPTAGIKELHEAVSDISSQQSQAEILKSLVQHAEHFAPRGAFFIIKNEHLVGWRVFGSENSSSDEKLRDVVLPVSSESILSDAVKSLETVHSSAVSDNYEAELFNRIEFGGAQQATAIPLVARGRGVAVLYADNGTNDTGNINVEALETLVRVAGLTVEVLASAKGSVRREPVKKAFVVADNYSATPSIESTEENANEQNFAPQAEYAETSSVTNDYSAPQSFGQENAFSDENSYETPAAPELEEKSDEFSAAPQEFENSDENPVEPQPFYDPAPSLAPSVREALPEEAATEELPPQSFSDAYQTEEYQFENPSEKSAYEVEELQPVADEYQKPSDFTDGEYQQPVTENFPVTPEYSESQNYSAREYAENFAKETDPSEYAKDFSYQSEQTPPVETKDFSYTPTENTVEESKDFSYQTEAPKDFSYEPTVEIDNSYIEQTSSQYEENPADYSDRYETPPTKSFYTPAETYNPVSEPNYETFQPQTEKYEETAQSFEQPTQSFEQPTHSYEPIIAPPIQATPKTRLSERNVDLPIEVSEDERRLHNDARRFARLLVSEIKLYNEQKVKEGRESGDLYDRLREAIDRSREMYDKRVQPPVAAKFDYFHYEILNTLAEGDENKLGAGYPGANVR